MPDERVRLVIELTPDSDAGRAVKSVIDKLNADSIKGLKDQEEQVGKLATAHQKAAETARSSWVDNMALIGQAAERLEQRFASLQMRSAQAIGGIFQVGAENTRYKILLDTLLGQGMGETAFTWAKEYAKQGPVQISEAVQAMSFMAPLVQQGTMTYQDMISRWIPMATGLGLANPPALGGPAGAAQAISQFLSGAGYESIRERKVNVAQLLEAGAVSGPGGGISMKSPEEIAKGMEALATVLKPYQGLLGKFAEMPETAVSNLEDVIRELKSTLAVSVAPMAAGWAERAGGAVNWMNETLLKSPVLGRVVSDVLGTGWAVGALGQTLAGGAGVYSDAAAIASLWRSRVTPGGVTGGIGGVAGAAVGAAVGKGDWTQISWPLQGDAVRVFVVNQPAGGGGGGGGGGGTTIIPGVLPGGQPQAGSGAAEAESAAANAARATGRASRGASRPGARPGLRSPRGQRDYQFAPPVGTPMPTYIPPMDSPMTEWFMEEVVDPMFEWLREQLNALTGRGGGMQQAAFHPGPGNWGGPPGTLMPLWPGSGGWLGPGSLEAKKFLWDLEIVQEQVPRLEGGGRGGMGTGSNLFGWGGGPSKGWAPIGTEIGAQWERAAADLGQRLRDRADNLDPHDPMGTHWPSAGKTGPEGLANEALSDALRRLSGLLPSHKEAAPTGATAKFLAAAQAAQEQENLGKQEALAAMSFQLQPMGAPVWAGANMMTPGFQAARMGYSPMEQERMGMTTVERVGAVNVNFYGPVNDPQAVQQAVSNALQEAGMGSSYPLAGGGGQVRSSVQGLSGHTTLQRVHGAWSVQYHAQ